MTQVVFYRSNGVYYGFEETGHTGYGESGEDILCSALSAMTMLMVNAIELSYSSNVDVDINEGATRIEVVSRAALPEFESDEKKRFAISGLFFAYYCQLCDLTDEYGDFLRVEVIDRVPA